MAHPSTMIAPRIGSSPFKGEAAWGMGCSGWEALWSDSLLHPIPTPALPWKGRERAMP